MVDALGSRSRINNQQRELQRRRAIAQDARTAFLNYPTFGNAFRLWLAFLQIQDTLSPGDVRSAGRFVRALRSFGSRGAAEPEYSETAHLSAEVLAQWVDDLAWSLNAQHCLNDNAIQLRTPTSRITTNFRSFIMFLGHNTPHIVPRHDFTYLLGECKALEEDLIRTARINRVMEEYVLYIQEAYFDVGRTVDETFYGEYEVEKIDGRRLIVLRRYDPDDDSDTSSASLRSFATFFPTPIVVNVKRGDTLTLQICHLEEYRVWVPYMYSGFTPARDDGGAATPTERRDQSRLGMIDDPETMAELQSTLQRLELSQNRRRTTSHREERRSLTPQRPRSLSSPQVQPETPTFEGEFEFDESRFTEAYFRAWDGDIDSDEDFSELLHSSHDELREETSSGGRRMEPPRTGQSISDATSYRPHTHREYRSRS